MNRYGCGALAGGVFATAGAIQALKEGQGVGMALAVICFGIVMGVGAVLWVTEKLNGGSGDAYQSPNQQIDKLQSDLSKAARNTAYYEGLGEYQRAAYWLSISVRSPPPCR